jgi:nucleoside recognition membrane protein YjiH
MTSLDIILNVLLALSFIGLGVFGVAYARNANWKAYPSGRAMMWLVASMALILGYGFVNLAIGYDYEALPWIRLLLYTNITFSIWHFVRILFNELKIDPFYMLKIPRKWRRSKRH